MFLLSSSINWAQVVHFISPITQTWPTLNTPEYEEVYRTIFFDLDRITVVTETAIGKEIREFWILSVEQINGNLKFYCTNRDDTEKISHNTRTAKIHRYLRTLTKNR